MNPDNANSLISMEKLDRASPDIWADGLPGVDSAASKVNVPGLSLTSLSPSKWNDISDRELNDTVHELSSLTRSELMDKVRDLIKLAYKLGVEETREIERAKFLGIIGPCAKANES